MRLELIAWLAVFASAGLPAQDGAAVRLRESA